MMKNVHKEKRYDRDRLSCPSKRVQNESYGFKCNQALCVCSLALRRTDTDSSRDKNYIVTYCSAHFTLVVDPRL